MSDYQKAQEQYEIYRFCYDNGHEAWIKTAKRCFDFYRNNQWSPEDLAQLRRQRRPALTFNIIESLVRSMKGVQRALRNDVRFLPTSDASTEDARIRDLLWLHVQNQNQLDYLESEVFEKAMIMGRAYYDVRVGYDESEYGQIIIRSPRSQDVVLDPSVDSYNPDEWPRVFERRWVSYSDILHMFGKDKAEAVGHNTFPAWYDYEDAFMSQQMGAMPYYKFESMSSPEMVRAYLLLDHQYHIIKLKEVFIDTSTGDVSEIPETWDRNRIAHVLETVPGLSTTKRKMKSVHWRVTCEGELLHSEDSPYKWFTKVPYFPTFVDGMTMGVVETMLDAQQMYNKVTSNELHILSTTANSGWKVKGGSLLNMHESELEERGSATGFVAVLRETSDLEKIQPNQMPQGHDRLSFKADQILRSLSGVSNQSRGFAREDVAGEAILANQAAQDVNFASYLSNLHRTKQLLAMRVLDCAAAHYTETRTLMITGGSAYRPEVDQVTINAPSPEGGVLNDITRGKYTTTLVPAPVRSTLSEEDFNVLLRLRELGVAIPDDMLIELSPAANKAQIIQKLRGDSNERDAAAAEQAERMAQLEEQLILARAQKEQSATALNNARAAKAAQDASRDPDQAYREVEHARMQSNERIAAAKLQNETNKIGLQRRTEDRKIAAKLTEIETRREAAEATAAMKQSADSRRTPALSKQRVPAPKKRIKG